MEKNNCSENFELFLECVTFADLFLVKGDQSTFPLLKRVSRSKGANYRSISRVPIESKLPVPVTFGKLYNKHEERIRRWVARRSNNLHYPTVDRLPFCFAKANDHYLPKHLQRFTVETFVEE